ncbi:MAG: TRAP transporter substrate-binding protein [Calditrichota bacterium]
MKKLNRRDFVKKASLAAAGSAAILSSCGNSSESTQAPAINLNKTTEWKMVTTWTPGFPILGEGAQLFSDWVDKMSAGRLKIKVYGSGELVPAFESLEAVQQGIAQVGHSASYYWAGKMPASQFFAAVPFGMNAQQMNAWIYAGGGQKLWEETYDKFNLLPMPAGNTGVQMGGWFNKAINTIDDFKGLKMRMPGLGGRVIAKAGGSAAPIAVGEIFTSLERNVIDATEWIGPYHDYTIGFHNIASHYYYPGWHEPGTILEIFFNKSAFQGLSDDLQEICKTAAARSNVWMLAEFDAKNSIYLQKIREESDVKIQPYPQDVLKELRKHAETVLEEVTEADPQSKKVYESFRKFKKQISSWSEITEQSYYENIK